MSDWGQWAEQIRDNPSKWAVAAAFHLVDETYVRAACVERLDGFQTPAEAQVVIVTDAGILVSSYSFDGQNEWKGSSKLIPWSQVRSVDVEQGGIGQGEVTVRSMVVNGELSLPLKEDHRELSEDECDVVRAILSRRTT